MPTVVDIFKNLKTGLIGTKTSKIDQKIDKSLALINKYSANVDRNAYIDTLKNLAGNIDPNDLSLVVKDIRDVQAEFFDRSGRIQRYDEFDSVVRNIAYCARALNVLTDCIISPDDITKRTISIALNEEEGGSKLDKYGSDNIVERLKLIKSTTGIEKHIDKIVRTTLKKGDYFVEILHSPKGENAFTIVKESEITEEIKTGGEKIITEWQQDFDIKFKIIREDTSPPIEIGRKGKLVLEYPLNTGYNPTAGGGNSFQMKSTYTPVDTLIKDFSQKSNPRPVGDPGGLKDKVDDKYFGPTHTDDDGKEEKGAALKDIFITLHDPRYVIRLQTERFKTCLGYLVFPKINMASMSGKSYSLVNSDIDSICMDIVNQLKEKINDNKGILVDNKELKNVVLNYLSSVQEGEDIKVRYVPPDYMTHFRIHTDVHEPYGESIFECILFDAKLLMALKTANTIKQLTSATDKRVISVETGLPHNAKNLVDLLKDSMKKRKISVDKFGSIDSIPSIISTFEDIYIPMRDGKKFVEIDNMQWGANPQDDIEPIKFIRDNIVANLSVPPAYLGLEENATNRNLLTAESVLFARTIVGFQKELGECVTDLFYKIYKLLYPDNEDDVDNTIIGFPPPKASMYEHELEYLRSATDIINMMKEQGVPEEYLKQKYYSFLDWDDIENYQTKDKLKKQLGDKGGDEGAGGMGGSGMGGGF